jgi:CopG antitoxin of type II toxin-antitoxin system
MAKKLKPIPHFHSEADEREFWESHDSTDCVDWSKAQRARFPNLKLSPPACASTKPRKGVGHDSN